MHAAALALLRCPHCHEPLVQQANSATCTIRHSFDFARQGYLSLLAAGAGAHTGDDSAMVEARDAFLGAGHYAALRDRLAALAAAEVPAAQGVLDLGAGTGYYTGAVLDALTAAYAVALDTSKAALRRAARSHPRVGAVAADAWKPLPVRDSCVDLALNVFAPRNPAELARCLQPEGVLLVVTPGPAHLLELRERLGLLDVQADKSDRLAESLSGRFSLTHREELRRSLTLDRHDVRAVVGMGPSARHILQAELTARVETLPSELAVSAEFVVSTWRPARLR